MRRSRILRWLVTIAMVFSLTAWAQAEEVVTAQYPDSNYDPGPGWPEGWTPPPVPAELPEGYVNYLQELLRDYPQYTRYEVRVHDPLPKWTKEYPYVWTSVEVFCGDVIYVYWTPDIDQQLIEETFGRGFATTWESSGQTCLLEPALGISEEHRMTPEEREADARGYEYDTYVDRANGRLGHNHGAYDNGSPENIHVYLNDGFASYHFDVPAYLDTTVSRVRVPIRFVSEFMGAEVIWNDVSQQVTIHFPARSQEILKAVPAPGMTYADVFDTEQYFPNGFNYRMVPETIQLPERTLKLTIGLQEADVDGKTVPLDAPPVVKEDRTMVPIRFVSEQIGAKVYWVGEKPIFSLPKGVLSGTYHVHIYTPLHPLYDYPSWFLENRATRF